MAGGAFLACDADLGDALLQTSGAFRYTTALAPPLVAGAQVALDLIRSHPHWSQQLQQRASHWRDALVGQGWTRPAGVGPVLPLLLGSDAAALTAQAVLEEHGLLSVAIRPPTVPLGTSRVRIALSAAHSDEDIDALIDALTVVGDARL